MGASREETEEIAGAAPGDSEERERRVELRLLDGTLRAGRVLRFSPLLHRLPFLPDGADGEVARIPISEIAYVRFHLDTRPPQRPHLARMSEVKVRTVTDETLLVLMSPAESNPEGFYGYAPEPEEENFERIFFYHHGVRTKELNEPFGQLLVKEKLAPEKAIEKGVQAQEGTRPQLGHILVEQKKVRPEEIEAALKRQKGRGRMRLGEVLLEAGLIERDDLEAALHEQSARHTGKKLGDILVEMGVITEEEMTSALAVKFHMPFVNLDEYPIVPEAVAEVDDALIQQYRILPVAADEHSLTVALSDPLAIDALDAIRMQTKKRMQEVLAAPTQLSRHIERLTGGAVEEEARLMMIERVSPEDEEEQASELQEFKAAEARPIVRLVNKIILGGLRKGASDIHLLPQSTKLRLAYRINGDLIEETMLEKWMQRRVISRLKILSGMDVTEHRRPQDGRMAIYHNKRRIELRISCMPGIHGESIVLRVLDKDVSIDLDAIGMRPRDQKALARLTRKPHGLLLVTGPTGSGKSSTLFALLKALRGFPLHIITIEDPVESEITGVNQIQINPKIDMTFARALRNILRHDPDVIMVGEMRDRETAEIGIEAALTGHLMLSTLHTNSAVDTIIRLTDLGIPEYLIAPALLGIVSQSLVKRLCPECRREIDVDEEMAEVLDGLKLPHPKRLFAARGCEHCNDTGHSGRVLLYEFLEANDDVRQAIHNGAVGGELQRTAEEAGMYPKRRYALDLAAGGTIDRDDLLRSLV